MRTSTCILTLLLLLPIAALADNHGKHYRWVDKDGVVHYGDSIPAEYAELPKQVVNDHGVTVQQLAGRKTDEEREAERLAAERQMQDELRRRQDQALLATYLSVDEILMHRDRRIELFQAQARVTELYLRNLERRLEKLRREASFYQPYSTDPEAPLVDPALVADTNTTADTIERHKSNLVKFQEDEQQIIARFEGDINRFKDLKGLQ